jgi:hypothetical protein
MLPVVLLSWALAAPALAQEGTAAPAIPPNATRAHPGNPEQSYGVHHPYAEHFADFLKHHAGLQGDLTRDPSLARDPAYLKAHPQLKEYLDKHRGVAEELRAHPSNFMQRVDRIYGEGRGPY